MKSKILISISALTLIGVTMLSTPFAFAQGKTTYAQMINKTATRLTKEVTDGKITNAQKLLILSELQSLKANKVKLRGMTKAQRKAFLETERTNLLSWAKQNGINPTYIFGTHTKGAQLYSK